MKQCKECHEKFPEDYQMAYFEGKEICQYCYKKLRNSNGKRVADIRKDYLEFLQRK